VYVSSTTSNSPAWNRVHFSARSAGVSVSLVCRPFRSPRLMTFCFEPITAMR
jgi:hypothetical protein